MPKIKPDPTITTRVLRVRLKDRHASELLDMAFWVNQVWNYSNELSHKVWERERRFIGNYEIDRYTSGASTAGVRLHSQTIQAVSAEYVTRRVQARRVKLRWRVSSGSRRSLGWVPFKASALRYRNGQLFMSGFDRPLSLWDSYGLSGYEIGAGCFSEDARGRWYLNVTVKVKKAVLQQGRSAIGIDLGLKDFAKTSHGEPLEAPRFYGRYEAALGVAQRARQKKRVAALHAKIKNSRKDFLHKASTALVRRHGAIFVGNVNASALARTGMAKSVLDAGWSAFRTMLQYKSDDAGVCVVRGSRRALLHPDLFLLRIAHRAQRADRTRGTRVDLRRMRCPARQGHQRGQHHSAARSGTDGSAVCRGGRSSRRE